MKFTLAVSTLIGLSVAAPLEARQESSCIGPGALNGALGGVQNSVVRFAVFTGPGDGTLEGCQAKCFSPVNAKCRSFAVRTSSTSNGACSLYETDITNAFTASTSSNTRYYVLPGIQGWVPENVAQDYSDDSIKGFGSYEACRGRCLQDSRCRGFGFKPNGNCQLYDVSLVNKVKPTTKSPYFQYYVDCPVSGRFTIDTAA